MGWDGLEEGRDYLRSRSLVDRRANGLVYTPPHIVNFVLDAARYSPTKALDDVRLLDPACGAGAFLVAAVDRLAGSLRVRGLDLRKRGGSDVFARILTATLLGIDVDPEACALTRKSLRKRFAELTGRSAPSSLGRCVVKGDFLEPSGRAASALRKFNPTLVVGNPPYVPTTRLSSEKKARYRERFTCAHGRIDLYMLFIEQGIALLSLGGLLAFITPNKFLSSRSGRPLRQLLLESGAIQTVANFESHRVFQDAAIVPCITVFEKGGIAAAINSLDCDAEPATGGQIPIRRRRQIPQRMLDECAWHLGEGRLARLATRLESAHAPLEEFAVRISAGIASGLDSLFVSSGLPGVESALLRPAVRGRDVDAFKVNDPRLAFLLPYRFSKEGSPELVDLANYPGARSVLEPHRERLSRRHCVRVWKKHWYDLHDPTPLDICRATKILVPDVADRNRFALDDGKFLPLHSAYYIIPRDVDPEYLVALLNSAPLTFLARLRAPVVKDGFSRYRRQVLASLPIPRPGRKLERQIAQAGREGDLDRLETLAAEVFDVNGGELEAIQRYLSQRAAKSRRPS